MYLHLNEVYKIFRFLDIKGYPEYILYQQTIGFEFHREDRFANSFKREFALVIADQMQEEGFPEGERLAILCTEQRICSICEGTNLCYFCGQEGLPHCFHCDQTRKCGNCNEFGERNYVSLCNE